MKTFFLSGMGIESAGLALQHGLDALPLNPERVYAAGHSSAATLALQLGGASPSVTGVIAFAPVTNLVAFMRANFPDLLQAGNEGAAEMSNLLTVLSPISLASELRKPVFLFHASTDTTVSVQESRQLHQLLNALGLPVTYREVDQGGHYDAMIRDGIPAAIAWLKSVPAR
jgi:dipeptidyl aminopeptidase/acylaminoacyl peptidase